MIIKIKEDNRLEEIRILDFDYGSEWTAEYIDAHTYERDEDENIVMSEEDFTYWKNREDEYNEIMELRRDLDDEELYHELVEDVAGFGEVEDTQMLLIESLREALGLPKKRYVVVTLYPEDKRDKDGFTDEWLELTTDSLEEAQKVAMFHLYAQSRLKPSERMEVEIRRQDGLNYDTIDIEKGVLQ